MPGLARHGCPGPTSLVLGFLWGNSPLTLRLPPCPRLTSRYGQYLTHAPRHITREGAILVPRARRFLVKLSRVALETRRGRGGHGGRDLRRELFRPHCDSSSWPPEHGFDLTGVRRLCHANEP